MIARLVELLGPAFRSGSLLDPIAALVCAAVFTVDPTLRFFFREDLRTQMDNGIQLYRLASTGLQQARALLMSVS